MDRQFVSSNDDLRSVGYELTKQTLEVELCDGNVYLYLDVPYNEFRTLMSARSISKYFVKHIKNSYERQQINIESESMNSLLAS
jgi:hypothetical protein